MDLLAIIIIIAIISVSIAILRKYNAITLPFEPSITINEDTQYIDNERYDIYQYNDQFFRFRDNLNAISNLDYDISDDLNQIKDSNDHFGEKISDIYDKLTQQKK